MRASKPSHEIKNQVADQNLLLAIKSLQRGNRIIVIDDFFATSFSIDSCVDLTTKFFTT
jgi:adenine/guanine phosphoribosyltransferase-like PRPP-binding protein